MSRSSTEFGHGYCMYLYMFRDPDLWRNGRMFTSRYLPDSPVFVASSFITTSTRCLECDGLFSYLANMGNIGPWSVCSLEF